MKPHHIVLTLLAALLFAPALQAGTELRVGDSIEVKISGVPTEEQAQVNGLYQISSDGTINLPYINPIRAAGISPSRLASNIQDAYRQGQIYQSPNIVVSTQNVARFVNVGGDVRRPSRVPYTADLTLLNAINAAGGFTEYANQRRVQLLRDGTTTVVDIRAIRRDPTADIVLRPGDQIEVPRSSGIPFLD